MWAVLLIVFCFLNFRGIDNLSCEPTFHKWSPERKSNPGSWLPNPCSLISKMLLQFTRDEKRSFFLLAGQRSPTQKWRLICVSFLKSWWQVGLTSGQQSQSLCGHPKKCATLISILKVSVASSNLHIPHTPSTNSHCYLGVHSPIWKAQVWTLRILKREYDSVYDRSVNHKP